MNPSNHLLDEYRHAWSRGDRPKLEDFLATDASLDLDLALELIQLELELRVSAGETPVKREYVERFAPLHDEVSSLFERFELPPTVGMACQSDDVASSGMVGAPLRFGRYRAVFALGEGASGVVYSAFDEALERLVALKVPKTHAQASAPQDSFLREARIAASLDHPNIVPVYDVQTMRDGQWFVVTKLIEGRTLHSLIHAESLSIEQTVYIVAALADALHVAHKADLVHRDVKPANVLIDGEGTPLLTDFGLALPEAMQRDQEGQLSGTPAYMSPEQVRKESHLLDGRTDIWSLGVILYEMLTRRRPFQGNTREELFDQILIRQPKPPRMIVDGIPAGIERVCLRALEKPMKARYTTALDFAEELRDAVAPYTTYAPTPIDTSKVAIPTELVRLLEDMARNVHENWAQQRIDEGWTRGPRRDDARRLHPCLVPYEELPESEKEYDRRIAEETLKAVLALGYHVDRYPG